MKTVITLVATFGFAVDCCVGVDSRLVQLSPQGSQLGGVKPREDCRTVVEGDACYQEVVWAMKEGIVDHPEWYAALTVNSSFEDFQEYLHSTARLSHVCPPPCAEPRSQGRALAHAEDCRTAVEGDDCYQEVIWAMQTGVVEFPRLYSPLTASSSFDDFQRFVHGTATFAHVCPEPCVPQARAEHCRTSVDGDACYGEVTWAMQTGIVEIPEFYSPLMENSSREDFQRFLHGPAMLSAICPEPCTSEAQAADCHASVVGEACYDEIEWAMQTGVMDFPQLYAPLTKNSSFEEFQRFLHGTDTLSDVCPEPCPEQDTRSLRPEAVVPVVSTEPLVERSSLTPVPTPVPTSAPTLRPGCPCMCEKCGAFPYMDLDGSDCLVAEELDIIPQFAGRFEEMDLDGDGCVNQTECAIDEVSNDIPPFQYTPPPPPECDYGYYASPGTSVCQRCNDGFTRRRRSEACSPCTATSKGAVMSEGFNRGPIRRRRPPFIDAEWLPDFDDCIDPTYLTEDVEGTSASTRRQMQPTGTDRICVNTTLNGDFLTKGDRITVSKRNFRIYNGQPVMGQDEARYETFVIVDKVGFDIDGKMPTTYTWYDTVDGHDGTTYPGCTYFVLDHPSIESFKKWDPVMPSCTSEDGKGYSAVYPCGCGISICSEGQVCDMEAAYVDLTVLDASLGTSHGTTGLCWNRGVSPLPTPVPTVRAVGDPHLVNLQGEHFDLNHEGHFELLRIPQNVIKRAEFVLQATVRSEHRKPCTTYITEVELSGAWFDGKIVQLRSYLKSHSRNDTDKFLGVRVLSHAEHAAAPWVSIEDWTGGEQFLFAQEGDNGKGKRGRRRMKVSLDKIEWYSRKNSKKGAPTVAGQFTVEIQDMRRNVSSTILIRQDLPMQEHLNVAMRRLSALGREDIGGLLGFDAHPESLEAVTQECQRHRDGLDGKKGPHHSAPAWKTKWEQIKARRASTEMIDDNEAVASLVGVGRTCVCASPGSLDLTNEEYVERLAAGEIEGVITDVQTARLAEAAWDE